MENDQKSDLGTPESHRHSFFTPSRSVEGKQRAYNRTQMPIDYYQLQGMISDEQYTTAKDFYRVWYYGSEKLNYVQMRYSDERGLQLHPEDRHESAEKYRDACQSFLNKQTLQLCIDVCCYGEWAGKRIGEFREALNELQKYFTKRRQFNLTA